MEIAILFILAPSVTCIISHKNHTPEKKNFFCVNMIIYYITENLAKPSQTWTIIGWIYSFLCKLYAYSHKTVWKNVSDIISMFMNLFALLLSNKFVVTMVTVTSQAQVLFLY